MSIKLLSREFFARLCSLYWISFIVQKNDVECVCVILIRNVFVTRISYVPAVNPLSRKSLILSASISNGDSQRRDPKRLKKYSGKKSIVQFVTNHVVKNGAWYVALWKKNICKIGNKLIKNKNEVILHCDSFEKWYSCLNDSKNKKTLFLFARVIKFSCSSIDGGNRAIYIAY